MPAKTTILTISGALALTPASVSRELYQSLKHWGVICMLATVRRVVIRKVIPFYGVLLWSVRENHNPCFWDPRLGIPSSADLGGTSESVELSCSLCACCAQFWEHLTLPSFQFTVRASACVFRLTIFFLPTIVYYFLLLSPSFCSEFAVLKNCYRGVFYFVHNLNSQKQNILSTARIGKKEDWGWRLRMMQACNWPTLIKFCAYILAAPSIARATVSLGASGWPLGSFPKELRNPAPQSSIIFSRAFANLFSSLSTCLPLTLSYISKCQYICLHLHKRILQMTLDRLKRRRGKGSYCSMHHFRFFLTLGVNNKIRWRNVASKPKAHRDFPQRSQKQAEKEAWCNVHALDAHDRHP